MTDKNKRQKLPSVRPCQLRDENKVVKWIAEVTSKDESSIRTRLRREFEKPGTNVAQAFAETGLESYVWNNSLERFYGQTDAFLYELVIWNHNRIKRRMRRWIAKYLAKHEPQGLNILSIGDGLGFDSLYLAQAGHKVTYYEVPGYGQSFAYRLFADAGAEITMVSDLAQIPAEAFDAILCLDVLEHVPDVPAFVGQLTNYLRPGGIFIVHAPFYMIHPTNPTHLKANRRYSGSLGLYQRCGLCLVDGEFGWNPLVLEKTSNIVNPRPRSAARILALRIAGLYLSLGRISSFPFRWIDSYRQKHNEWFD